MLMELLEHYAMGVKSPKRVVVSVNPVRTVSPRRARRAGIEYDSILVRKDGWTVGFPCQWRREVQALYPDDWEAVCYLGSTTVVRMDAWKREGDQ